MEAYATAAPESNIIRAPHVPSSTWSIGRRLAHSRDRNGRTTTGAGARRRAAFEHQLDDHLALVEACDTPGGIVTVDRSARLRTSAAARRYARASAAILPCETIEPRALLAEALGRRDSLARSTARTVVQLLDQVAGLHPDAAGWALRQAQRRAQRVEGATRYLLPRRSWPAFTAWRQVVRAIARLLLLLARLLSSLIPLRRHLAPRPQAEEPGGATTAESRAGTTYGDQREVSPAAEWFHARPFPGM